jgi:hypothetical protein
MTSDFDANTLIAVLCVFAALMGIFCYCERKTRKRNRHTRSGWRATTTHVHDASCRSGWRAHTNTPRF